MGIPRATGSNDGHREIHDGVPRFYVTYPLRYVSERTAATASTGHQHQIRPTDTENCKLHPRERIVGRIIGHRHADAAGVVSCGQGASILVAGRCVANGSDTRRGCAGRCTASRVGCSQGHSSSDHLESPVAHRCTEAGRSGVPGTNAVRVFRSLLVNQALL